MKSPKLGTGGFYTVEDQKRFYREQMGDEKADLQERLAAIEAGKCICVQRKIKRRWDNMDKPTTRTVHSAECPKRKRWMEEAEL